MHGIQGGNRPGRVEQPPITATRPQDHFPVLYPHPIPGGDGPSAQSGDGGLERGLALVGLGAVGVVGLGGRGPEDVLIYVCFVCVDMCVEGEMVG